MLLRTNVYNSFHNSALGLSYEDRSPKNVVFGAFTALSAPDCRLALEVVSWGF